MTTSEYLHPFEDKAELKSFLPENSLFDVVLLPWAHSLIGSNARILDIAAGQGIEANLLEGAGFNTVALEPSHLLSSSSYHDKNIGGTAGSLPFKAETFSGVMCKDALVFLSPETRKRMFSEIRRVLVPNGSFLVVTQRSAVLRVHYVPQESSYPQRESWSENEDWQEKVTQLSKSGKIFSIEYRTLPDEVQNLAAEYSLLSDTTQNYDPNSSFSQQNRWAKISGFISTYIKR